MLDLAKVESGKMEFRPEPVDLGQVVGEVRDILRGLAAGKRLRIEIACRRRRSRRSSSTRRELKQVLYNYLSNAIKFTPKAGASRCGSPPEGPDLFRLEVEDTGIGISPESLEQAVRRVPAARRQRRPRNTRARASASRSPSASSRRRAAGSKCGARSKGSTFSAILPRVMNVLEEPPRVRAIPTRNTAILVVDDDVTALKLAETTLAGLGCPILCRRSAETALRASVDAPPSLVVLDLVMPGVDGFEFLARFRELPECRHTPVIVWTVQGPDGREYRPARARGGGAKER